MKLRFLSMAMLVVAGILGAMAQQKEWNFEDIYIRDPCIVPVPETKTYYLYRQSSVKTPEGKELGGVEVFTSKDLKKWYGPKRVFTVPEDNWITGTVWAPEVHRYKGKYYLFATLNSTIKWKKSVPGWPDYVFRGTQIFHSDKPDGPFLPFSKVSTTPMDEMALDGTLYVEDGVPYMVYCHEWVELKDGAMNLIRLKDDLSGTVGEPMRLFCASAAPWSTGKVRGNGLPTDYVTDGCYLYKTKTGKLLMLWSSFLNYQYAMGIAESVTGKITGPWIQQEKPIFSKDGGHGMLFRSFEGKLYLVLHGPNQPEGAERGHLFELEDTGNTLVLKGEKR